MEYDWKSIGERIRCERKDVKQISQEELSEMISSITGVEVTRRKIIYWESGAPIKKVDELVALCEIFDCDLCYLLCETNTKRATTPAICEELGLSQNSVDILIGAVRNNDTLFIKILSDLIEDCKSAIENDVDCPNYGSDILTQILLASTYDLGQKKTLANTPDGYSAPIHSRDIYFGLLHNLHKSIDIFIESERKKANRTIY